MAMMGSLLGEGCTEWAGESKPVGVESIDSIAVTSTLLHFKKKRFEVLHLASDSGMLVGAPTLSGPLVERQQG